MGSLPCFVSDLRIEDDLYEAGAVAQVEENQPTMIAAAVYPAVQGDLLPDVLRPQYPAVSGALEI